MLDDKKYENLLLLATALRDRNLWSPGFRWNYKSCETCALGLAKELGILSGFENFDLVFGIRRDEAIALFVRLDSCPAKVTPEDVAHAIELFVAKKNSEKINNEADRICFEFTHKWRGLRDWMLEDFGKPRISSARV